MKISLALKPPLPDQERRWERANGEYEGVRLEQGIPFPLVALQPYTCFPAQSDGRPSRIRIDPISAVQSRGLRAAWPTRSSHQVRSFTSFITPQPTPALIVISSSISTNPINFLQSEMPYAAIPRNLLLGMLNYKSEVDESFLWESLLQLLVSDHICCNLVYQEVMQLALVQQREPLS